MTQLCYVSSIILHWISINIATMWSRNALWYLGVWPVSSVHPSPIDPSSSVIARNLLYNWFGKLRTPHPSRFNSSSSCSRCGKESFFFHRLLRSWTHCCCCSKAITFEYKLRPAVCSSAQYVCACPPDNTSPTPIDSFQNKWFTRQCANSFPWPLPLAVFSCSWVRNQRPRRVQGE